MIQGLILYDQAKDILRKMGEQDILTGANYDESLLILADDVLRIKIFQEPIVTWNGVSTGSRQIREYLTSDLCHVDLKSFDPGFALNYRPSQERKGWDYIQPGAYEARRQSDLRFERELEGARRQKSLSDRVISGLLDLIKATSSKEEPKRIEVALDKRGLRVHAYRDGLTGLIKFTESYEAILANLG